MFLKYYVLVHQCLLFTRTVAIFHYIVEALVAQLVAYIAISLEKQITYLRSN